MEPPEHADHHSLTLCLNHWGVQVHRPYTEYTTHAAVRDACQSLVSNEQHGSADTHGR